MQFTVPKFLEREAAIAFGLTFKKLAVLGGLGLVLFFLYYILPKIIFILVAILTGGLFLAFTFVKVGGQALYEIVINSFGFLFSPRIYIWEKKEGAAPIKLKEEKKEKKEEKRTPLKIAPKSRLSDIRSKIDLGPSPE